MESRWIWRRFVSRPKRKSLIIFCRVGSGLRAIVSKGVARELPERHGIAWRKGALAHVSTADESHSRILRTFYFRIGKAESRSSAGSGNGESSQTDRSIQPRTRLARRFVRTAYEPGEEIGNGRTRFARQDFCEPSSRQPERGGTVCAPSPDCLARA